MDFHPRDCDSRDEDRAPTRHRGGRDGSDRDDERADNWAGPATVSRDRDDEARDLGRGPGDSRESQSAERSRDARDDARSPELGRDERTRDTDPREDFTRRLNLPRGLERELVRDRDREYTLQAVALTKEGRSLLEHHRDRDQGDRQTFYNGVKREREPALRKLAGTEGGHPPKLGAPANVR